MTTESLGALTMDFLLYYGTTFPYATSYISVTEGRLLPKATAPWIKTKVTESLAIQCLVQPGKCFTRPISLFIPDEFRDFR